MTIPLKITFFREKKLIISGQQMISYLPFKPVHVNRTKFMRKPTKIVNFNILAENHRKMTYVDFLFFSWSLAMNGICVNIRNVSVLLSSEFFSFSYFLNLFVIDKNSTKNQGMHNAHCYTLYFSFFFGEFSLKLINGMKILDQQNRKHIERCSK